MSIRMIVYMSTKRNRISFQIVSYSVQLEPSDFSAPPHVLEPKQYSNHALLYPKGQKSYLMDEVMKLVLLLLHVGRSRSLGLCIVTTHQPPYFHTPLFPLLPSTRRPTCTHHGWLHFCHVLLIVFYSALHLTLI